MRLVRAGRICQMLRLIDNSPTFVTQSGGDPKVAYEQWLMDLDELFSLCEDFKLKVSQARLTGFRQMVVDARVLLIDPSHAQSLDTWKRAVKMLHQIPSIVEEELELRHVFTLDDSDVPLFESPSPFGEDVLDAFPSTAFDIEEAAKCLGLRRGTACVFHLTRVLQAGLYALALDVGVSPANRNWETVIADVEVAIRQQKAAGPGTKALEIDRLAWETRREFNAGAAMQFSHIKDAYRNRAIHRTGLAFTEEKSRQIFDATRAFMQHLATRLKEQT